ncbi:MAG: hypothetical protein KJ941_07515 [Bacteroidetes bacterium]|nr:hypothetical protein [Bacteroidota bacterium]
MLLIYSFTNILLGVLTVSLSILVLVIAYKKLLAYLGKGVPNKAEYAVLYTLENQPCKGEIEFFYELKSPKTVRLELLNSERELVTVIDERNATPGGTIVRFDSLTEQNGDYYYQIVTDNQKTIKKMRIENPR